MTNVRKMDEATVQLVERLRQALPGLLAGTPVRMAYLFGSTAEGRTTPLSDVDIALVFDPQPGGGWTAYRQLMLEMDIEAGLEDCCRLYHSDVRIINHAPLMLRGRVVQRGCLLYSADEDFRIGFETLTLKEYLDWLPTDEWFCKLYLQRRRKELEARYG